ncbi:MAG: YgeY family selenium metabolism-linked hydrolase [Candidatus Hydrothermae bacterium]|nr:YgeY family selenium metabolism-linked hydrolase [Candidatus Hydrothermae bacterium]
MEIWGLIRQRAEQYRDYTSSNLSEIVRIRSLSGEEREVIEKIKSLLESADFDEVKIDGLGNLIGRVGNGEKILAIDAHIDTVDTGDINQWEFDPFSGEIKDGFVLGRGSVDQKGGAASMITAGKILKELGYDGLFTVYFTFTIMEEDCDGMCWNYIIEKERLVPDFAILTEPTNLGIYRGHRGRMEIELYFRGISAHASAPERGDNAIYKASRAALEIEKLNYRLRNDDFLGKGSIAATLIESKSPSLCAIPDHCRIHLDRRLTWGETRESAIEEVREVIGNEAVIEVPIYNRASYKGTLYKQEKYFPTWKIPEDHYLVKVASQAYELLFQEVPRIGKWTFSTNGVAICGKHGIPTIGFGPGNEVYAHAPNEKIPIDHLVKASAFYALMPYILEETID